MRKLDQGRWSYAMFVNLCLELDDMQSDLDVLHQTWFLPPKVTLVKLVVYLTQLCRLLKPLG